MSTPASLNPAEQSTYLRGIVERVARSRAAGPPVVVFDLDGTLLDNRPRTVAILRELGEKWRGTHDAEVEQLMATELTDLAYSIADTLGRRGVVGEVQLADGQNFWKERFFSNPYLRHDVAIAGAVRFAHEVYRAGATLVYLTGRDLPNMSEGSLASLRDTGFPIGVVGTELVCKPDFAMSDETYKRDVAPTLARLGEVVASFDNEPANCNVFLRCYPACASVLLDTQRTSHAPPLDEGVVSIRDFSMGE